MEDTHESLLSYCSGTNPVPWSCLARSRNAATSTARTAILSGGAVVTTVLTVVSLLGAISGVVSPAIWSTVVVEAVLATAFGYFLLTSRKPRSEGDTTEVTQ
ncbi:MAG: hypothetical protein P8Y94_16125 [Acidobacteriota bacterium]